MERTRLGNSSERGVCERIVEAVAERSDTSPVDLSPPLYDAVDPDALETLVGSHGAPGLRVGFTDNDCAVTVTGSGAVDVSTASDDDRTTDDGESTE